MRRIRTTIQIVDVQAKPSHINSKGIQIEGMIMISVKVKYGRKYDWSKAYGFLPKDLKNFDLETFKVKIYEESRIWIRENDLQAEALKKLRASKGEAIFLD